MWNPDTGADTKCSAMELTCHIMFYNQLPTADTIHKWAVAPEVVHFHIGAITDVELGHQVSGHERCEIRFYIQSPPSDTIHKWTLAPEVGRFRHGVEPGHWGGHQVSGHETDVSSHVL